MEKRGLSSVVATVLIVLLSLAAIAIVWGFIGPTIREGSQRASIAGKCLDIELTPIRCEINGTSGSDLKTERILIELNRGKAETMRLAIRDSEGKAQLFPQEGADPLDAPANIVETVSITNAYLLDNLGPGPYELSAVATFLGEKGEEEFCDESPTKIDCTNVP
ncbi:hypothetical protein J4462_03070 [Candidatus Pacearchaeota archaeon]|nr:hypothetical protein [Candidatus Pacearchaeota archaeon]